METINAWFLFQQGFQLVLCLSCSGVRVLGWGCRVWDVGFEAEGEGLHVGFEEFEEIGIKELICWWFGLKD